MSPNVHAFEHSSYSLFLILLIATSSSVAKLPDTKEMVIQQPNSLEHFESLKVAWNAEEIVPEGYNTLIPPRPGNRKPVRALISLNITQILSIKEDEQVKG